MPAERLKPGWCQHCRQECADRFGSEIYPNRPELAEKVIWVCPFCGARVGTHEDGADKGKPLGTAANLELRRARMFVHEKLDPLWKEAWRDYPDARKGTEADRKKALAIVKRTARVRVYAFLAEHMGLTKEECHVAMFDLEECRKAYRFLRDRRYSEIRDWAKQRAPVEKKTKSRPASGS